jgi:hypothetical protein
MRITFEGSFSIFCQIMLENQRMKVEKNAILLLVSVAFAEYSIFAKYSAEYTAETIGQNHLWSDTSSHTNMENLMIWHARHQMIHNYLSSARILMKLSVLVRATLFRIVVEYYEIRTKLSLI